METISSIASDIFHVVFIPASANTFFSPEEKVLYCLLLRTFFPAGGNHCLNYKEAYLKLLSLLCSLIFQIFLPMLAAFSSSGNVFINKFSIPTSENRFSVYLKQYSFIWKFFSC